MYKSYWGMNYNHMFETPYLRPHIRILQIVFRLFYFEFLFESHPHKKQDMIPMSPIHSIDNQLEKKLHK